MTTSDPSHAAPDCIWCGAPFDDRAAHLLRRTRCAACGAATTDPPPTEAELADAYGDWYRPHAQRRFYFAADAILGRTRGLQAARIDEIAPAGPVLDVGAGDGTLVDALRAPVARPPASSATPSEPTSATSPSPRSRASGRPSCSGTRSSTSPTPGRRSAKRLACCSRVASS